MANITRLQRASYKTTMAVRARTIHCQGTVSFRGFPTQKKTRLLYKTVLSILSLIEYNLNHKTSGGGDRWRCLPLFSLNGTEEGGVIKAGNHKGSKHTSQKRLGQLAPNVSPCSGRRSVVTGSLFFSFSFLCSLYREKNCQLY
jgi:hypothetical protein